MAVKGQPWSPTSAPHPNVVLRLHGATFHLNKECMISKSAKLATLLSGKDQIDLTSNSLTSIPADARAFDLVARFCHGQDLDLSPETVIPLACVSSYLEMTDDNLINRVLSFLTSKVLPFWDETVRALRSAAPVVAHAHHLGLVDACLNSISDKVLTNPTLLREPIGDPTATGVKRKLFVLERCSEDLTSLTLPLYELAVSALTVAGVTPEQVAHSVYRYTKRWVDPRIMAGADDGLSADVSVYAKSNQREVIEAAERLLSSKRRVIHVGFLFEMLRSAIFLQASPVCRDGLETKIGKQLPEALIGDLCIPCYGYSNETKYDVKCVLRILDHFSRSYRHCRNLSPFKAVTAVVEEFSAEVGADENVSKGLFVALLKVVVTIGNKTGRCHDGVYRAIDVFLDAHGHLTVAEREEVCRVLDCHRMSSEACAHAAQNERLPLRVVAQVLFVGQRRIREAVTEAAMVGEGEKEEEKVMVVRSGDEGDDEEEMRKEMMMMDSRVMELEREHERMRRDIEKGRKRGLWKEIKGLLGCMSISLEPNCHGIKRSLKKQKLHPVDSED